MNPFRQPRPATESLLKWYDINKKDLPWRGTIDPYRVWIGEVMSQQTTLKVVVPRYRVMLGRLPDARALAACPDAELRQLWSGLGYYARAKNLKKGAAHVIERLDGRFPSNYGQWLRLPGVGPYTAAVVSSICNKEPIACLDGNVIRVMSRLSARSEEVWTGPGQKAIQGLAQSFVETTGRPGDANQAIMELGQAVCQKVRPLCPSCPLHEGCEAFARGVVADCPPPRPRPVTEKVHLTVVIPLRWDGAAVAIGRRTGRFLRNTPGFALHEDFRPVEGPGDLIRYRRGPGGFSHAITRHRITATCCLARLSRRAESADESQLAARLGLDSIEWIPRGEVAAGLGSSLDKKAWRHGLDVFAELARP